jgi:hypothetical protein
MTVVWGTLADHCPAPLLLCGREKSMTQPESRLSRKIRKHLEETYPGIFVFKVWGSEHMMAGLPDLLGCWQGRFFGLEVKMPEKRMDVSPRQRFVMRLIADAGGTVAVVTTTSEADVVIRSIPGSRR